MRNNVQLVARNRKQLIVNEAILHSDQWFQYTTKAYANVFLLGSYSPDGSCYYNACIESFISKDRKTIFN